MDISGTWYQLVRLRSSNLSAPSHGFLSLFLQLELIACTGHGDVDDSI